MRISRRIILPAYSVFAQPTTIPYILSLGISSAARYIYIAKYNKSPYTY